MEKIYKCNKCGAIFEKHEVKINTGTGCYEDDYCVGSMFSGRNYYEYEEYHCPECYSEDIVDGYLCNECESFHEFLQDEFYGICEDCVQKYTEEEYYKKYPMVE